MLCHSDAQKEIDLFASTAGELPGRTPPAGRSLLHMHAQIGWIKATSTRVVYENHRANL